MVIKISPSSGKPCLDQAPQAGPYSMSTADAAAHFGLSQGHIYNLISSGALRRGDQYLKLGRKILIVRDAFIAWLRREDGAKE